MKLRLPIIIALFSVMAFVVHAQNEIHFTQFEMAPIQQVTFKEHTELEEFIEISGLLRSKSRVAHSRRQIYL